MKYSSKLITVLAAFLVVSCSQDVKEDNAQTENYSEDITVTAPSNLQSASMGKVIVEFSEELAEAIEKNSTDCPAATKAAGLGIIADNIGITSIRPVFRDGGVFEQRHRQAGLHRYYEIEFEENVPVTRAMADFSGIEGVRNVEPVLKIKLCATEIFNDPYLALQWNYHNDGSRSGRHKAGADINILPVWEYYTTGNSDVIVGVVDGGIQFDHPDLADNYYMGENFAHSSTVVPHDHGTHVAGTIAAINNNGIGLCGIAGGDKEKGRPGVKLLSAQIFEPNPNDPDNDYSGNGASAIVWACDNGAVISQNSWGFDFKTEQQAATTNIPEYLKSAIDYFIKNAGYDANGKQTGPMAGGVVIFAAGNSGWNTDPIGKYDPVISVGAMAPDFGRAYYSNYGSWVDIAAPGGDAYFSNGSIWSTVTGGKYEAYQGTSMACPHVSGVAALLVSYFGGPGFTNEMLKEKLLGGANPNAIPASYKIGPLLDAYGAFTYGRSMAPAPVTDISVYPDVYSINLKFKVTEDELGIKAFGYKVFVGEDKEDIAAIEDYDSAPSGVKTYDVLTGDIKAGEEITIGLDGLRTTTTYYIAVAGYNSRHEYSEMSEIITAATTVNFPPEILLEQESIEIHAHETVKLTMEISDRNAHGFETAFSAGSNALSVEKTGEGKYEITISGPSGKAGEYTATFKATDIYGGEAVKTLKYTILKNNPPQYSGGLQNIILHEKEESFTLNMAEYFSDPDGENLTFKTEQSERTLFINTSGSAITFTSIVYGLTTVTVTASDFLGYTEKATFKVLTRADDAEIATSYPNPVKDALYVCTSDEGQETHIVIRSATGKTVRDVTATTSAFDPAIIDLTGCAAGRYVVNISCKEGTITKNIVKL